MNPFIGEIRIFGFTFAPLDWAFCDGQLLAISQNTALFSILGTTYGGNGTTTFALPNMQDRSPMHWGQGSGLTPRTIGETLGTPSVALLATEIPQHNHVLYGAGSGDPSQWVATPNSTAELSSGNPGKVYASTASPPVQFSNKAIGGAGQSQPHQNLQPLLTLNFCISLYGIFPARN